MNPAIDALLIQLAEALAPKLISLIVPALVKAVEDAAKGQLKNDAESLVNKVKDLFK